MTPTLCIGIVPTPFASDGGVFQYSQTMLSVIDELAPARRETFCVVADDLREDNPLLEGSEWSIVRMTPPPTDASLAWRQAKRVVAARLPARWLAARDAAHDYRAKRAIRSLADPVDRSDIRHWLASQGVDALVYAVPTPLAFEIGLPYVLCVHDLQHRLQPHFPEVSAKGEALRREYLYRNGVRNALLVVVDSDVGKDDVLTLYGDLVDKDRIVVLPFLARVPLFASPAAGDRVRRRFALPPRYIFYPAQFWPHKNHLRIVEALASLRRVGLDVPLVLVGATTGTIRARTYRAIRAAARRNGVADLVRHLGYVAADDIPPLYAGASALVMPTFFGPTNIPILEAWSLGCPVVTSDVRGVREQAGDGALLVDPTSVEAIADAIRRVWLNAELRDVLRKRGAERIRAYTRDDYRERLGQIIDEAVQRLNNGAAGAPRARA